MYETRDRELEWELEGDGESALDGDREFALDGDGEFALDGDGEFALDGDGEFALDADPEDQFIGGAALRGLSGLLGGGGGSDEEFMVDPEDPLGEGDPLGEAEDEGEEFLPALLPIATAVAPLIGRLFGGGRRRRRRPVRESEWELEGDPEYALDGDGELEGDQFLGGVLGNLLGLGDGEGEEEDGAAGPALAEVLATVAAESESEAEAEAMIGAATVLVLTPRERRALARLIPQLVQTAAVLTRVLRRRRRTRRVVRVIPTMVKSAAKPLTARVAAGQPLTQSVASRVVQGQVQRVLARPAVTRAALRRNAVVTRRVAGHQPPRRRVMAG